MVIYYDVDTKEIKRTEDNTMSPILPADMELEGKREYYKALHENFISLPYEIGASIFGYTLCFNTEGIFIGLQPKEV